MVRLRVGDSGSNRGIVEIGLVSPMPSTSASLGSGEIDIAEEGSGIGGMRRG